MILQGYNSKIARFGNLHQREKECCFMDKSKVAVIQCTAYDEDAVYEAVESGIKLLGGA